MLREPYEFNVDETTNNILETIVGNRSLKKPLKMAILLYKGALEDISNNGPLLRFYLCGPPDIGKTTIISRIQEHVNHDQTGLIRIPMSEIKTFSDMINRLQNASPLQSKTIFLDEFQALDNIQPIVEQSKVIEFLKLVFATEEDESKSISAPDALKERFSVDLKDTIWAIATNIDL